MELTNRSPRRSGGSHMPVVSTMSNVAVLFLLHPSSFFSSLKDIKALANSIGEKGIREFALKKKLYKVSLSSLMCLLSFSGHALL